MEKILVFYQKDNNHRSMDIYDCSIYVDNYDFNVIVGTKSIDDFLYNEEIHKNIIKNCGKEIAYLAENQEYFKDFFRNLLNALVNNDYLQFFNQFDIIKIDYNVLDGLEEFLLCNKEYLANKKILIPFYVNLSPHELDEVKTYCDVVKKVLPNATIVCSPCSTCDFGSRYYVDVQDYFAAYIKRENLLNLIKSLNLSPLEEIAFIYDYLKKGKYKKEEKEEPWYISRGLINVLVGDKIVCMGYVELFKSLVEALGHSYVNVINLKKRDQDTLKHERAMIYVKDDKYGIDGNYIFDVTFDCTKRDDYDNSNDYYFFLRTLEEMNKANNITNQERIGLDFLEWSKIEELMEKLSDFYTEEEFNSIIKDKKINHNTILSNMHMKPLEIEKTGNKKEDLLHVYELIYESFNKRIEYSTIIELFYNVRKIEYYLDPANVSFIYDDLVHMTKSYLATPHAHYAERIKKIIDYYDGSMSLIDVVAQFIEESLPGVKEDIERVKLTRGLREYLLKKKNQY